MLAAPIQDALEPAWLVSGTTAAAIVRNHLPEEHVAWAGKKLRWALHAHDHFEKVLGERLAEAGVTCPRQVLAERRRLKREFKRGERKYPPLPAPDRGGRPRVGEVAYFRAKLLAPFYEVEDNSEALHRELSRNADFLISCGFSENGVPSVRSLQRYEFVAQSFGLWRRVMRRVTADTRDAGLWHGERVAIDPTHGSDYASVRKVSKASKDCGCERCQKEPIRTCTETDIVAKSRNFKVPGVKAGIITDADSELPIAAFSFNARKHDGTMGAKLVEETKRLYPDLAPASVLLDGAFDAKEQRSLMQTLLPESVFFISPNPRRRKAVALSDEFVTVLSPLGVPQCRKGDMDFAARDATHQRYVFRCPAFDPKTGKTDCPLAARCRGTSRARYFTVPRAKVPFVDWENPHFTKTFKKEYNRRTSTERVNARLKWVLPFDRVWGRGKTRIQAHWDKMVLAFHLFAYAMHQEGADDRIRSIAHPFSPA